MASDVSINTTKPITHDNANVANVTALPRPKPALVDEAVAAVLNHQNRGDDPLSGQQLLDTVNTLNENAFAIKRSLQFNVDEQTGTTVITVRNSQTDEVIRQIPSEALLKLAQRMEALGETPKEVKGLFLQSEI